MGRLPDRHPGPELLELLRAASHPLSMADLRDAGIDRPAQAVYDLQRAGHRILRSANGLELFEGDYRPAPPPEPPPRVRRRPRER